MTIVFYDTETTGTDAPFDQILQFAAIHTDAELNEIERFEVRSRIQPHVIPSPGAVRVNGVTVGRLTDPALPSHYQMARAIREKLHSWSPALFMGYNSLAFDEHFLRQALYQTLHLPYLTNTNGNSRSDVLRMLQAASVFVPNSLAVPIGDDGKPVFRLDRVAPANGFDHRRAHDAMADVEATIHMCRILCARAPEIWSSFMRFSQKAAAVDYVSTEPVFCLSEFYYGRPYCWLVTALGRNAENSSEYYVYNLGVDPDELAGLTEAELVERLQCQPKPLRRVRCNAAPILMSAHEAPVSASGKSLAAGELYRRVDLLRFDAALAARLVSAFESVRVEREPSPYVELQIYDGFFTSADQELLDQFHLAPWERRPQILDQLFDPRLQRLGRRLVHAERPDLLSPDICRQIEQAQARRILGQHKEASPWRTLPQALDEIEKALREAGAEEAAFLREHKSYLATRQQAATRILV